MSGARIVKTIDIFKDKRIKQGKADIENDIKLAEQELTEAKKSHIAGFADIADGETAIPVSAKKAKSKIAEIGGRILGLKETLPDFAEAIKDAENEMKSLRIVLIRARAKVSRVFLDQVPKHSGKQTDLNSLMDFMNGDGTIDLNSAMMLYLAAHDAVDNEGGGPFPPQGQGPDRLFHFMSRFFRKPNDQDIAYLQNQYEAMIWGDREPPEKIKMPDPLHPDDGIPQNAVNWNLVGGN